MWKVKIDLGIEIQTLEFGCEYAKFSTREIMGMVFDLMGDFEAYVITIERV